MGETSPTAGVARVYPQRLSPSAGPPNPNARLDLGTQLVPNKHLLNRWMKEPVN